MLDHSVLLILFTVNASLSNKLRQPTQIKKKRNNNSTKKLKQQLNN